MINSRHDVVAVDLPGHGASPDAIDLSIEALALDLSCVLTQLNIRHPVLYGHSIGGMIIQEYCIQNHLPGPKAMILQNCSYTNPLKTMPLSPIPLLLQSPLISPALKQISRRSKLFTALGFIAYTTGLSSLFYRLLLFTGKQSAATLRTMAGFAANTKAKTTAEMLMTTFNFDAGKALEKIEIPCLVMGATADRIVDPAASRHLHQKVPGSELVLLKGGASKPGRIPRGNQPGCRALFAQTQYIANIDRCFRSR